MNSAQLKALQTPLKEKYRNDPVAALVTLKAEGKLGENISCKVETGRAIVSAGLHPATGGDGLHLCSGDMLLEALVACAGVTLNAVATAMGIDIKNGTVKAEGDINFSGTLGVSKEVLVGFKTIRLYFLLETDASKELLEKLLQLTERYCVVYQTITKGTEINTAIEN
jgi:uncharacterized OsmC-like protein